MDPRNRQHPPPAGHPEEHPPLALYDRFPTLKEAEEYLISEALSRSNNNQGIASFLLGISRYTLNKRLVRKAKKAEIPSHPDICGKSDGTSITRGGNMNQV